ncbi:hypothetical protein D3C71_1449580 [compost metagenome]
MLGFFLRCAHDGGLQALVFADQIPDQAVIDGVVSGRLDFGLEAFTVNRYDFGCDLLLQIAQNTVDVVTDQGRHTAVEHQNRARPEFTLGLKHGLSQLGFAAADDIDFAQVGVDPAEPNRRFLTELLEHFVDSGVLDQIPAAADRAVNDHDCVTERADHPEA